ncbi:MAG: metallophosphoesterase [Gemmatimonadetes bacterium]|nr:metallophosphoesterase [Gemmatimonadota bacterium]
MRIASLADTHLGFAGPGRSEGGRAVREIDVERAFSAALDRVVERQPDLVTFGGDNFHSVVPSTAAKIAWRDGLQRILDETSAHVVVVGGNHCTPRTSGVVSPNMLAPRHERMHVERAPGGVYLVPGAAVHGFGCSYLNRPGVVVPEPVPDALNVLLIHAAVRSSARPDAVSKYYAGPDAYDVARAQGFDVVACGDFHEFRLLAGAEPETPEVLAGWADTHGFTGGPLAFYSGSIERTSSDIWSEHAPKGFVFVDTDARTLEFVEVPGRPMFDWSGEDVRWGHEAGVARENGLEAPDWSRSDPLGCADLNECLRVIAADPRTGDALVRLRVDDFPRAERDGIDWLLVGELQRRCVLFRLDIRHPEAERVEFTDRRERAPHTLEGDARLFFAEDEPPVQRACFDALGLAIPQEVGA